MQGATQSLTRTSDFSLKFVSGDPSLSRLLLDEAPSTEHYVKLSKIQATAVADMIAAEELSNQTKSDLSVIVAQMPWAQPDHCDMVLAKLVSSDVVKAEPGRRRRQLQDFRKVYSYLTAAMWEALANDTSSADAKLSALLQHSLRLGLRLPTEPSFKMLASLWTLSTCDDAGTLDNVTKAIRYKRVKDEFDAVRRKAADPVAWVDALPDDPLLFQHKYPALCELNFSRAPPAPPGISADVLIAFDHSYNCRGGLKTHVNLAAPSSIVAIAKPVGHQTVQVGAGDFQQMAVNFTQHTQASQQRLLEMVIGGGGQSPRQLSLATLHDRAQLNSGAFILQSPSRPASPPALAERASVEEVDSPPGSVPSLGRPKSFCSQPAELKAVADDGHVGCNSQETVVGKGNEVEDILDTLAARKASNAAAAKAAKAEAKAGAMAKPAPKADAKAQEKTASASNAAALKAKVAVKSKAAAKALAAKYSTDEPTAKKPKVGDLVLGCGRCRGSPAGCSTCRNPNFKGVRGTRKSLT